jgi:exosortase
MNSAAFTLAKPVSAPFLVLTIQVLAFWPIWMWFFSRLKNSGEEAWGLAGILAALCVLGNSFKPIARNLPLGAILMTLAYALAFPFLPPLLRAALALTAMACLFPLFGISTRSAFHAHGFLLLSLPVIPSFQFYLGYPLRALSGEVAARLLNLSGFPVIRKGALLTWDHLTVFIDAPCSGIKMLWSALFFSLALSALRQHSIRRTVCMWIAALVAVVFGNSLRTTALFFLETKMVAGPAWMHSAVGLWTFASLIAMLAWAHGLRPISWNTRKLRLKPCVP